MEKTIFIEIDRYKSIACTDDSFEDSLKFDEQSGIIFLNLDKETNSFRFKIVDNQRYFFAKLCYGI